MTIEMAILKGQNFRILTFDTTTEKYKCVGMATNCTVSLNTNTESIATKDDYILAEKPAVVSKSWQVQVDSLDVSDVAALLTAIKNFTKFKLLWTETMTMDNQAPELDVPFARTGDALLTDATFQFDDRTNSTKSLQFTGVSPIAVLSDDPPYESVIVSTITKGQYVRLFLSSNNTLAPAKVIAAAKQLSLHISVSLEDSTTKDTDGDFQVQEPTALNYDISSNALVRSGETITSSVDGMTYNAIQEVYEVSEPVKWQIANVSGANNRTKGSIIASGSCIVSQLQVSAANRGTATYQTSLTGYGAYTVGA